MHFPISTIKPKQISALLPEIPECPKTLQIQGEFPVREKYLAVVGSRKYSEYGKAVCEHLIKGLAGQSICIVSGLALGIDAIAHRAALSAGLATIAIPGSGLGNKVLYPTSHHGLAQTILEKGGCLISEFEDDFKATTWSFPQRNRIVVGLSHATFVIEAELQSGTLISSKYAIDFNRDVFTIPHPIFSKTSEGPHMLLRLGATPITSSADIIAGLGLKTTDTLFGKKDYSNCSADELEVVEILSESRSRDEVIRMLDKPIAVSQTILAIMEIKGLIEETMGEIHLT
ncbi:MAG: DNA-processing protein DprA [Candidatus Zambryskibacteria bacterium]|nr:DNA-processing protein DprA [Candidatus Zambryskibacteria bacterium]